MRELLNLDWSAPAGALALSFLLSLSVALVYRRLNRGLLYVQTFPQALAVSGVVSAMIVLSIGDNIARGIGLVGALTVIRFRSTLKDPRDLIFAFAALATGVGAGAHAYTVAVLGTGVFLAAIMAVSGGWFSKAETFNAILSLHTSAKPEEVEEISRVLRGQCREFTLVRVRHAAPGRQEHAYQVLLKQPERQAALVDELENLNGVDDAMLVAYDSAANL